MIGYSLENGLLLSVWQKKEKRFDSQNQYIKKSSTQINESNSHPIHLFEWTELSSNFPNEWINKSKNPPIHLNESTEQSSSYLNE